MNSESPISAAEIAENISALDKRISVLEDELTRLHTERDWWDTGRKLFGGEASEPDATEMLPFDEAEDEPATNGAVPSLRTRLLTILGQEPRRTWKSEAIITELRQRDWLPKGEYGEHRVRSMLSRLHRRGEARRVGRGAYRLPSEPRDGP